MGHLLDFPSELLAQILALLPVRTLLNFSETSRYARSLANGNLSTISLDIHPIRPRNLGKSPEKENCVRIPEVHTYDYQTITYFHDALVRNILLRHAEMLQVLDLSIWTFTIPIAMEISRLLALQKLSIRIEDDAYARAVPRAFLPLERLEQDEAWDLLGQTAEWRDRLRVLKIENADLTMPHLVELLEQNHSCRELSLSGCRFIGEELWNFLGYAWIGGDFLQRLHVADCGGCLNERVLKTIVSLSGLQVCPNLHVEPTLFESLTYWKSTSTSTDVVE